MKAKFYKELAGVRISDKGFKSEASPRRLTRPVDTEYEVSRAGPSKNDISRISGMRNIKDMIIRDCNIKPNIGGKRLKGLEQLYNLRYLNIFEVKDISQEDKDILHKLSSKGVEVWY